MQQHTLLQQHRVDLDIEDWKVEIQFAPAPFCNDDLDTIDTEMVPNLRQTSSCARLCLIF